MNKVNRNLDGNVKKKRHGKHIAQLKGRIEATAIKLEFSFNYRQYSLKLSFTKVIPPGRVSISKLLRKSNLQELRTGHLLNMINREF